MFMQFLPKFPIGLENAVFENSLENKHCSKKAETDK